MKTKKMLAIILAIAMTACIFIMPANAAEAETHEHIEIIIENEDISEETREKIMAHFTNGGEECDGTATYGLTCTLLGHKLESTRVYKITHEARSTAPRCLKKSYDYSTCTRCDYEENVLVGNEYIFCC